MHRGSKPLQLEQVRNKTKRPGPCQQTKFQYFIGFIIRTEEAWEGNHAIAAAATFFMMMTIFPGLIQFLFAITNHFPRRRGYSRPCRKAKCTYFIGFITKHGRVCDTLCHARKKTNLIFHCFYNQNKTRECIRDSLHCNWQCRKAKCWYSNILICKTLINTAPGMQEWGTPLQLKQSCKKMLLWPKRAWWRDHAIATTATFFSPMNAEPINNHFFRVFCELIMRRMNSLKSHARTPHSKHVWGKMICKLWDL